MSSCALMSLTFFDFDKIPKTLLKLKFCRALRSAVAVFSDRFFADSEVGTACSLVNLASRLY